MDWSTPVALVANPGQLPASDATCITLLVLHSGSTSPDGTSTARLISGKGEDDEPPLEFRLVATDVVAATLPRAAETQRLWLSLATEGRELCQVNLAFHRGASFGFVGSL